MGDRFDMTHLRGYFSAQESIFRDPRELVRCPDIVGTRLDLGWSAGGTRFTMSTRTGGAMTSQAQDDLAHLDIQTAMPTDYGAPSIGI